MGVLKFKFENSSSSI